MSDWRRRQAPQSWRGERRWPICRPPLPRRRTRPRGCPGRTACHELHQGYSSAGYVVGVSSQGTVRSPQESSPVLAWAAKASDAGQDIQSAVQSVQGAIGAGDVAGAKAACQQMSDANQRLNATLPTPVRALTSEVRGVVDEIGAASSVCLNAGPNAGQAEIDSFTSHLNAAMAHYTRAQEIGAGAAGPRPRPGLPN